MLKHLSHAVILCPASAASAAAAQAGFISRAATSGSC